MARRALAIAIVGACLLAAGCGGDDSSERAKTPGTSDPAQIPDIPAPAGSKRERGGDGSERSSDGDGSGESGDFSRDGPSRSDDSTREGGRRRDSAPGAASQPEFPVPGTLPPSGGGSGGGNSPARTEAEEYRLARELCANVTLKGIALNLRIGRRANDPEFVAEAFSRQYPRERRDAAYRGCLAGFRNPVNRR